ncbi:MAG: PIG-L deacetylase family protein [Fervidobacterium sp.]|uniref:PIG-L deacetylase family protein n=1 Tax=Fervidobacterium sp. TaxID=1871331 RepID=UPI0040492348
MFGVFNSYLFIGAHPDDIEIWAGGFILRILRENKNAKIHCLVLTDGSAGYGTVEERKQESLNAAEMLGTETYEILGLKDGSLCMQQDLPKIIANLIRKYKPDVLVTHPKTDRHPDHSAVGEAIEKALFMAMTSPEFLEYEPHMCKNVLFFVSDPFQMPSTRLYIDISEVFEEKYKIIQCFKTQLDVLLPYIELNKLYGKLSGVLAAEIFEPVSIII